MMRVDTRRQIYRMALAWPFLGVPIVLVSAIAGGSSLDLATLIERCVIWSTLSLVTPPVMLFAERHPPRAPWSRFVAFHVAAMLAMATVFILLNATVSFAAGWTDSPREYLAQRWSNFLHYSLLLYSLLVVQIYFIRQRRKTRISALAAARLARRLASVQLEWVRSGIDPRAVFASLDEIDASIRKDPLVARERIQELSRFLRSRLELLRSRRFAPARKRPVPVSRRPISVALWATLAYLIFGNLTNALFFTMELVAGADDAWFYLRTAVGPYGAAGALSFLIVRGPRWVLGRSTAHPTVVIGSLCFLHALLVEGVNTLLLPYELGRNRGEALVTTFLISILVAHLVRGDKLEWARNANRLAAQESARLIHEARLKNLSNHIAPHFLFNTLNSVLTLVTRSPAAAELMLRRLRRLLRVAIDDRRDEVSLREELEVTNDYIEIERVRFGANLDVRVDVDETLLAARVPHFLLQPLVENAIRHGVLGSSGVGRIRVSAERHDRYLRISVENDDDILDSNAWQEGIGLAATRARLTQRYGCDQELAIDLDGGVTVHVRMPLQLPDAA